MSEVSFAKAFLGQLDSKPVKLPGDHVFDRRSFQPRQPFTLPRLSDQHPQLPKKIKTPTAPGATKSITIHLKSARNPVLEITLDHVPLATTTIQELKEAIQGRVKPANAESDNEKVPLDKIKILWKRKPVHGKLVTDALANEPDVSKGGKEVEFGIMILGGATALPPQERPAAPPMEEPMIQEVVREPETARIARDDVETSTILQSESFWEDLEGFLKMRLKDEGEAMRLRSLLRSAWESSS